MLLGTAPETSLDALVERPLDEGGLLTGANTVIHLGKIREGRRFRRAMYMAKHRGSACTDRIIPFCIHASGLWLEGWKKSGPGEPLGFAPPSPYRGTVGGIPLARSQPSDYNFGLENVVVSRPMCGLLGLSRSILPRAPALIAAVAAALLLGARDGLGPPAAAACPSSFDGSQHETAASDVSLEEPRLSTGAPPPLPEAKLSQGPSEPGFSLDDWRTGPSSGVKAGSHLYRPARRLHRPGGSPPILPGRSLRILLCSWLV